jgi:hypothetical protein
LLRNASLFSQYGLTTASLRSDYPRQSKETHLRKLTRPQPDVIIIKTWLKRRTLNKPLASQAVEVHEPELILQYRTWQNLQRRTEELQCMPSHLILLLLMICNSPQFYQPEIHRSIDMHIQTQNMLNTASLKLYQSLKMQSLHMNNMKGTMATHQVLFIGEYHCKPNELFTGRLGFCLLSMIFGFYLYYARYASLLGEIHEVIWFAD